MLGSAGDEVNAGSPLDTDPDGADDSMEFLIREDPPILGPQ